MNDKIFQIALSLAPRVGDLITKQLISYLGSPEEVLKTPKAKLLKIPGIGNKTAEGLADKTLLEKAEKILTDCDKNKVKILHFTEDDYPSRLKAIDDSPSLLYSKGNLDLNPSKSVAIVGTREATRYGKKITEQIVEELKSVNAHVVSGLAYGIDIMAHKKCLEIGVPTVGVMANGIDSVYPANHKAVAQQMYEVGAVITENPPGSKPDAPKFPARNRIIAGMTDVTIVVEGAVKGGALITAYIANDYGKEVFAVPGPIDAKYSMGCNKLIRNHKAHIFTSMDDLTSIMNWGEYEPKTKKVKPIELNPNESKIFDLLSIGKETYTLDVISRLTQISVLELLPILLTMEFNNIIRPIAGNEYELR